MKVKYGFKEKLMDFLNRGPLSWLAIAVLGVVLFLIVVGGFLLPPFGIAMFITALIFASMWAVEHILENWR